MTERKPHPDNELIDQIQRPGATSPLPTLP